MIPAAFMSYSHTDDAQQRLTEFGHRLAQEIQLHTGEKFEIFQDRNIRWGQEWRARIEQAIDTATLLIAILSPSFFKSRECQGEVERFLAREKDLQRDDLILPVYFIDYPAFNNALNRHGDDLTHTFAARQLTDWRDFRFEPWATPQVSKMMADLAKQVRDRLESPSREVLRIPGAPKAQTETKMSRTGVQLQSDAERLKTERAIAARPISSKSETPVHLVDQKGQGDYKSIVEAIAHAKAGDRILIRPGVYTESLIIEKSLEILGDGERRDVVLQAENTDVIMFQSTLGRIANLAIRQTGGGNAYAIDIAQGRLELEDCDITSDGLACVAIHNGADPRMRRNTIHDGKHGGVLVYAHGLGTLEENDIFGNGFCDLTVMEGSNPTIRRNRIHHGTGVLVYKQGLGLFEDNDIFSNDWTGLEIATGANPTVRRNRIHDNNSGGVFVYENGKGTLEENDIYGNDDTEVTISEGGNPILRHNRIHDSKAGGVFIYEQGRGILEDNDVFGNSAPGIEISTGGNPTLRRNHIRDGKREGVWVYEKGAGVFEHNEIVRNAESGVEISDGGRPTFVHNRIKKNRSWAVWVYEKGGGIFEDNELRGNVNGAFKIARDSRAHVIQVRNRE